MQIIRLSFLSFHTDEACISDKMHEIDGRYDIDIEIGTGYCGILEPFVLHSSGQFLLIQFITDDTAHLPGFEFSVELFGELNWVVFI